MNTMGGSDLGKRVVEEGVQGSHEHLAKLEQTWTEHFSKHFQKTHARYSID